MKKKILIITPFFAPETHAAVFRAHKLAKYLNRENWEVHVLTVDTNYVYNEDENLLKELEGVTIHRAKYIEPTLRGLRMWLTGKDLTFKTLKAKGAYDNLTEINTSESNRPQKQTLSSRIYKYLLDNYLNTPDRFWTWEANAVKLGAKIIKDHNIGTIYTTCLPFTTNKIGLKLKKQTGVNWVADFRDPITYAKRMYSHIDRIFLKQKKIQDLTFEFADAITGLSSAYNLIFHDQYSGKYIDKFTFIPTGLDDDYLPEVTVSRDELNEITFIGEYLEEYEDFFFKIYKKTINGLDENKVPKINIVGNIHINKQAALKYLKPLNLQDNVRFIPFMPQKELYRMLLKSRFVILLSGNTSLWWTNFAKLVDYIALKKRVLAFVPDISEARSELKKAGLGIFITNDVKGENKLRELFLSGNETKESINTEYCKKYLASSQTKSFIKIFENIQK